jgi:hypothetical protein
LPARNRYVPRHDDPRATLPDRSSPIPKHFCSAARLGTCACQAATGPPRSGETRRQPPCIFPSHLQYLHWVRARRPQWPSFVPGGPDFDASASLTPPLFSPSPALKYSVMIPVLCAPQGKRGNERLRNRPLSFVPKSESQPPLQGRIHVDLIPGQDEHRGNELPAVTEHEKPRPLWLHHVLEPLTEKLPAVLPRLCRS